VLLLLLACTPSDPAFTSTPDRSVGTLTPLATGCDALDSARCWLPWPSFASTEVDTSTATGLRVAVAEDELPLEDDPSWIELADGFSRVSPVLTVVEGEVDAATAKIRLFDAASGAEIPSWAEVVVESHQTLIIGYPADILPAGVEIVAVVTDEVRLLDGAAVTGEHLDDVALGRAAPTTQAEEDLRAWSAPIRTVLDGAGITAVRAWSFPTRSAADVSLRAAHMIAGVDAAELSVTITEVQAGRDATVAAIVYGTIDGVPEYRIDREEWLNIGEDGLPVTTSTHSALFRVVVPAGDGDWPVAFYGHGTGGDVGDSLFDSELSSLGIGKAGMQFHGWNGEELIGSVAFFSHVFDACTRASSALLQSVADGHAIMRALDGPLADALSAETLGGAPNPAAGRRPTMEHPIWIGGSLSGTMGAVIVAANEDIDVGILNVPGAAWTHFIPTASLYTLLVDPITHAWYPSDIDRRAALAMSQNIWDDVDGAAWEDDSTLLLQESMGDPVLPNVGTAMLARARGAVMVGPPLDEMLSDLATFDEVEGQTAITQFYTPYTEDLDIHGFAEDATPAGSAAQEQILGFLTDWRDGRTPRITLPSGCQGGSGCDFRE
jgi:hypothetical protein